MKMIDIKHHVCDGCCMWSGIEDVYANLTREEIPDAFFLAMASYGENVYLKFKDNSNPRMLSVCDGRTRSTYSRLKDMLGMTYKISEGCTYEYSLKMVRKEIDNGRPVLLGPIDMYYIPYLKMYHHDHIPMHYVMAVGYDETNFYIYDCGREEQQVFPVEELRNAWNIEKNAVGDKNGFVRFSLPEHPIAPLELVELSMKRKAKEQLAEKPRFVGVNAFRLAAEEFPKWSKIFDRETYITAMANLTSGFYTVPKVPNRILGIDEPESEGFRFTGNLHRLGNVLITYGDRTGRKDWIKAGDLFTDAGQKLEEITEIIVNYICDGVNELKAVPELLNMTADLEEQAYRLFL